MLATSPTRGKGFLACALLAATSACTCGGSSLAVTVEIAPRATTTRCVTVSARAAGAPEVSTAPIPRAPAQASVEVGVFQGDLPENISLVARGYDDALCTRLNEEAIPNAVSFQRGQVLPVTLYLEGSPCVGADAGTPCPDGACRSDGACVDAGTELDCADGADDDGDGREDCLDADCLAVACAAADLCLLSPVCQADGGCDGTPRTCELPPGFCFLPQGTCSPSSGTCSYAGDTSKGCDDSDACTVPDRCLEDGGCGGPPVSCGPPPGQCFGPTTGCDPALGCRYPVLVGNGCDDGAACTYGDRCDEDAGCAGSPYSCLVTECTTSACDGDGGCSAPVPRTGEPCDGGVCSAGGTCVPAFPYAPSNFDPVAIAGGGISPGLSLTCNNAWFNSTDGGHNWCGQPPPVATAVAQDAGPEVVVLAMSGLNVASGASLTLVGTRPVILAVYGDATVAGTISARSGTGVDAGAGADPAGLCSAGNGAVANGSVGSGGGGGGYGLDGGQGGTLTGGSGIAGGAAGAQSGNAEIIPLRGGCSGGEGGRPNAAANEGGRGGRGGGAVQLSAARLLDLTGSGRVTASGAGGEGGVRDQASSSSEGGNGGGGGGSGGAVLLEGQDVLIRSGSALTGNGGGGGEGGDGNAGNNDGDPGSDGPTTTSAGGAGGAGRVSCASDGAVGGSAAGEAGSAGSVSYSSGGCATGGGGGAAGRIRINGHRSCVVDAGVMSPSPSLGGICQ